MIEQSPPGGRSPTSAVNSIAAPSYGQSEGSNTAIEPRMLARRLYEFAEIENLFGEYPASR